MSCNCISAPASCMITSSLSSRHFLVLKPFRPSLDTRCMSTWAQDWSAAFDNHADLDVHSVHAEKHIAVTYTPHPAAASSREAAEWEAVLTTAGAAAASPAQQFEDKGPGRNSPSPVYAVVECGSHSTRLLLSTGARDVVRMNVDTHLGAAQQQQTHAAAPAQLGTAAMTATLQALQQYEAILQQHNVAGRAAAATAAVRKAADSQQFVDKASAVLGCQLQVLSGAEEGQLAFIGATSSLAGRGCPCLVFDLGGNSTEFATGTAGAAPEAVASIPLGCLAIAAAVPPAAAVQDEADAVTGHIIRKQQQHQPGHEAVQHDKCQQQQDQTQQHLQAAATAILAAHQADLQAVLSSYNKQQQQWREQQQQQPATARGASPVAVIGTGGTITTIAALQQQLQQYDCEAVHMCTISQQDILQLVQQIAARDSKDKLLNRFPWLTAQRLASLLAGCCGVLAVMQRLDVQQVLVSERDLLDGMLWKLQQTQEQQD